MSKAEEAASQYVDQNDLDSYNAYSCVENAFVAGVEWLILYIEDKYPALFDCCAQPDQDNIELRKEVLE